MPYKGSKNGIAREVIAQLPPAEHFYDLFCGGCALTHAAMLSEKYKYFHINDIDPMMPAAFLKAVNGGFNGETRWVDRETFNALKATDPYVAMCFSFGSDRATYAYGKNIEPWKKALHYARVLHDFSLLRKMGIGGDGSYKDCLNHDAEYTDKYSRWIGEKIECKVGDLESLQRLQRLQRLQSGNLEATNKSYDEVEVLPNSVIICDIPYKGTNGKYRCEFDHEAFYKWARTKENIYICEYNMPEEFQLVNIVSKPVLATNDGGSRKVEEKRYIPKGNKHQQTDLFGF